jgi:hypothetical protein
MEAARDTCIATYGNTTTAKFLTAWKFITRTLILGTMMFPIWSLLQMKNIKNAIRFTGLKKEKNTSRKSEQQPLRGTSLQNLTTHTSPSESNLGKEGKRPSNSVRFAGKIIQHTGLIPAGSAGLIVGCESSENAGIQHSKSMSHTGKEIRVPTFTLNTDFGCYFAGGILVANCSDAWRYLLEALGEQTAFDEHNIKGVSTGGMAQAAGLEQPRVFVPRTFTPNRKR